MQKKKVKMVMDFYRYLFFLKKSEGISLIINLSIFFISLINISCSNINFKEIDQINFFIVILFLFSLFNVIWDAVGKIKEIKTFAGHDKQIEITKKGTIVKEDFAFKIKDIKCKKRKNSWNFENISIDGSEVNCVIRSKELNQYIWNNTLKLNKDKKAKVEKFILKNKEILAPFFQYKYYNSKRNQQYFFNEYKLCMSSDIYKGKEFVRCYKSNYYNSFLTNEICMFALKRVEDATIIYDATNFYPCEYNEEDKNYYLHPIDKSEMNNHIGVSTLAITEDNYFVLRKQGIKSQQNVNKYVPTGSGSCDWSDIREGGFSDTIEYAMKRELWEENGEKRISPTIDEIGETKILGFFRWLERGGKPEFVGVTKLKCCLNEMEVNTDELIDISSKVDMDTLDIDEIDDIPKIINLLKGKGNLSVPLYMCLDALEIYHKERSEELKEFLKL